MASSSNSAGVGTLLFARSANKNNKRNRRDTSQSSGEQHENTDDIWDDTALIEHYERSIQITYEAAKLMTNTEASSSTKMDEEDEKREKRWQVADECYAPYLADGQYYRAQIAHIFDAEKCDVTFSGYDETQTTDLDDLYTMVDYEHEQANDMTEIDCDDVTPSPSQQHQQKEQRNRQRDDVTKDAKSYGQYKSGGATNEIKTESGNSKTCVEHLSSIPTPRLPCPVPPDILQRGLANHMKGAGMMSLNQGTSSSGEAHELSAMLMSWYMCGYHTGYYQAVQDRSGGETQTQHSSTNK